MTTELPPLPVGYCASEWGGYRTGPAIYTADQLRAYAAEAVRLARQQALEDAARLCDVTPPQPFRPSIEAAHAIRALKDRA